MDLGLGNNSKCFKTNVGTDLLEYLIVIFLEYSTTNHRMGLTVAISNKLVRLNSSLLLNLF